MGCILLLVPSTRSHDAVFRELPNERGRGGIEGQGRSSVTLDVGFWNGVGNCPRRKAHENEFLLGSCPNLIPIESGLLAEEELASV